MKFALVLIALAGFASTANAASLDGRYVEKKYVIDYDLADDEKQCKAEKGIYEEGMCLSPVKDVATIKPAAHGFDVSIQTWGNDMDGCYFEGRGQLTSDSVITASEQTDRYVNGKWETGAGLCTVTVTLKDNFLSVTNTSEDCETLCGVRATLDIEKAKKVRTRQSRP